MVNIRAIQAQIPTGEAADKVMKLVDTWPVMVVVIISIFVPLGWLFYRYTEKQKREREDRYKEEIERIEEAHRLEREAWRELNNYTCVTFQKTITGLQDTIKDLFQAVQDRQ